jgi:hypothetical protein
MPAIVRRGVTLAEALQEAAAVAPIYRQMLYCYELWHPTLAAAVYFDNGDLSAFVEATADRNAGLEVEFLSCPMTVSRPEESDQPESPKISMSRPDLAGMMRPLLDAARGSLDPWILIERVYASDDLSAPALLPPLEVELTSVDMVGSALQIAAQFDDDGALAVPAITFRRVDYPGLQR